MPEHRQAFRPVDLLACLNQHGVSYILIGGVAARAHGSSLHTGDVDICPEDHEDNAGRLADALSDLEARLFVDDGSPLFPMEWDRMTVRQQRILNLMTRFGRLDVVWEPAGTSGYDRLLREAWRARIRDIEVMVISLDDLIATKAATGRPRDETPLEQLRFLRERSAETDEDDRDGSDDPTA